VYHVTWFVNSAAHVWGSQSYNTGDLSRNNWWVREAAQGWAIKSLVNITSLQGISSYV
jgi:fatty-acid desaturase